MKGLEVESVAHAFGAARVLEGASLAVHGGEIACLIGPSGCGKTTLLRIAAGLEPLQRGRVAIDGETVAAEGAVHVPPERRGVGLMFQDYALFPHLTVFENVAFGVRPRSPERLAKVRAGLHLMGLGGFAEAYPHTLSGGQQQRVALLRALAPEPRVLLLDEPFSGLDVTLRAQVRTETRDLIETTGIATLMVTHDPEEAMYMADRLFVMRGGRVVQAGPPVEIYLAPADAFVAALFGPVNRLAGRVAAGAVPTPFGPVAAPGLAEGTAVEVLIRPEGLKLALAGAQDPDPGFRVASARLLGRSSIVRIVPAGREGDGLQARVFDAFLPPVGVRVAVTLDPRRAFVFPLPAAGAADPVRDAAPFADSEPAPAAAFATGKPAVSG